MFLLGLDKWAGSILAMDMFFAKLAILLSAVLSTSVGFGFALLSVPILLISFSPKLAITVNISLALLTNLINLPKVWPYIDSKFTLRLIAGTLPGIPIGTLIFINLNINALKIMVSVLTLLLALLMIKGCRLTMQSRGAPIAGVLAGILGAAVSLPGPPLILYLSANNTDKKRFVGIIVVMFCVIYTTSLALYIFSGNLPDKFVVTTLLLIPSVLLGVVIGSYIREHINHQMFKKITYSVLIISACYTLITSL